MSQLTTFPRINKILDPRKESYMFEDFGGGIVNSFVGTNGWRMAPSVAGYVDVASVGDYDSTMLGAIVLSSDTGIAPAYAAVSLGLPTTGIGFVSGGKVIFETRVKIPTLRTVAEEYQLYLGMANNVDGNTAPTTGIYFVYSVGSAFWQAAATVGGVSSSVTSSVTVAINTWYRLKAEVNEAGTRVDFFINDVNIGNVTTNIPNTNASAYPPSLRLAKSAGILVENKCFIDYYTLYKKFNPTR